MSTSSYDIAVLRFALSNLDSIVKVTYRKEKHGGPQYIIGRITDAIPNAVYISYCSEEESKIIPIQQIIKVMLLDGTRQIIREEN